MSDRISPLAWEALDSGARRAVLSAASRYRRGPRCTIDPGNPITSVDHLLCMPGFATIVIARSTAIVRVDRHGCRYMRTFCRSCPAIRSGAVAYGQGQDLRMCVHRTPSTGSRHSAGFSPGSLLCMIWAACRSCVPVGLGRPYRVALRPLGPGADCVRSITAGFYLRGIM